MILFILLSILIISLTAMLLWVLNLKVSCTTNNGGEIAAQVLKAHNVKFIFTLIGGHIAPILVESEKIGIKIIDVRQECTSVFAADAMSRLSGEVGIAIVTAGPGITNTVTALKNAQMAQSPLILIGGSAPTLLKNRGSLQDIDQMSLIKSLVKFKTSCSSVRQINDKLRECFYEAKSGIPGPVFIEIAVDLLWPIQEIQSGMGLIQRKFKKQITSKQNVQDEIKSIIVPSNIAKSKQEYFDSLDDNSYIYQEASKKLPFFLYQYMNIQLKYMFGNAFTTKYNSNPKIVNPLIPSTSKINKVYNILAMAKKPVFLLGSQTMLNAKVVPQISAGLEKFGIPIFCGGMARGLNFKANKFERGTALREADVVVLFGIPVDFRLNYGKSFNKKSTIITVNRSLVDMTMNSDIFWKPKLKVQCDPGQFIIQLCKKESLAHKFESWFESIAKKQVEKQIEVYSKGEQKVFGNNALQGQELVNPIKLFQTMNKVFASDKSKKTIYIGDGGDFIATAAQSLVLNHSLTWLDPGAFGTLGCGAGFALACKLYHPDAEVIIVWGDGSAGYGLIEYDTFQRHNLNIKSVIGNDACWKQVERDQAVVFKSSCACQLDYSNYHEIAKVFKGDGAIITNNEDLEKILLQAKQTDKPFVVNVLIGDLNFREGALSV